MLLGKARPFLLLVAVLVVLGTGGLLLIFRAFFSPHGADIAGAARVTGTRSTVQVPVAPRDQEAGTLLSEDVAPATQTSLPTEDEGEPVVKKRPDEDLRGKPGVIWGRVVVPGGAPGPMQARIGRDGEVGEVVSLGADLAFAVSAPSSGNYEVVVYETSETPGMRLEGIAAKPGLPLKAVELSPGDSTVRATVTDDDGVPLPGVRLTVGKASGGSHPAFYTWRKGLTNLQGEFVAAGLADGLYVVAAKHGEQVESAVAEVPRGETIDVSLTIPTGGAQVRGVVLAPDGTGVGGYVVNLEDAHGMLAKSAETLPTGEFAISHVKAGLYAVAMPPTARFAGEKKEIYVDEQATELPEFEFRLLPMESTGTVVCEVAPEWLDLVPPLALVLMDEEGVVQAALPLTPSRSAYTFSDCRPGPHLLSLRDPGDPSAEVPGLDVPESLTSVLIQEAQECRVTIPYERSPDAAAIP